jgi:hypothetical protein
MALTDTEIRKAKQTAKPYKLSDGAGLYLWVTPSGGRKWRASYRHDGKQKTMTFGGYPEVSLAMARDYHRKAKKLLVEGQTRWQSVKRSRRLRTPPRSIPLPA